MHRTPLVSVITAAFNASDSIAICIESVINQSFDNWEYIIVNDGSTDNTAEICNQYAIHDERIKLINKPNGGVSSARNAGLSVATGKYVLVLDSDDRYSPDLIQTLLTLQENNDYDCIIFGIQQDSGEIWSPNENRFYGNSAEFRKCFSRWLDTELLSSSVNKLYKRELIYHGYPEDMAYGEDLCFCIDYLSGCKTISFVNKLLYLQDDLSSGSLTKSFKKERLRDIEKFQEKIIEFSDCKNMEIIRGELSRKYARDVARQLHMLFRQENLTYQQKNEILQSWRKDSFLMECKPDLKGLSLTGKFLLTCVRYNISWVYDLIYKLKHAIF